MDLEAQAYGRLSLWLEQAGDLTPRPALPGPVDAEVAIVGAGFTGLWTAYYLKKADPTMRVVVLEKDIAGYGASGRNGGWCFGHLNGAPELYLDAGGRPAARALKQAGYDTIDEIEAVLREEGIDAGFHRGGALVVATSEAQAAGLKQRLAHDRRWDFGPDDVEWRDRAELLERVRIAGAIGALEVKPAARVQPARFVRRLADVVQRLGVEIYERTEVTQIRRGVISTVHGEVTAPIVVRGTEAYTHAIPGQGRRIQPITSQIIATEPLPPAVWDQIGWAGGETIADSQRLAMYAQRTVDDRIAIGGRGGKQPRHGSAVDAEMLDAGVSRRLRAALTELWPAVAGAAVTHEWAGVWGAARDWCPSVGFDRAEGLVWAGGYGDGVAASNLAARTMRDLILERETELTLLPWVNRAAPSWPPAPLPRLGAWLIAGAFGQADRAERRTGRPPRWVAAVDRVSRLADK
jgi:glycine/D-amino acid oxidase-like deaminating enzyme